MSANSTGLSYTFEHRFLDGFRQRFDLFKQDAHALVRLAPFERPHDLRHGDFLLFVKQFAPAPRPAACHIRPASCEKRGFYDNRAGVPALRA